MHPALHSTHHVGTCFIDSSIHHAPTTISRIQHAERAQKRAQKFTLWTGTIMQTALGLLGFSDPYDITLELDDATSRRLVLQNGSDPNANTNAHSHAPSAGVGGVPNGSELLPLFRETETIGGRVTLAGKDGKPVTHRGVRIEFVGAIQMLYDRERSQEFVTQIRHLDDPGTLSGERQYSFEFTDVEKKYETYTGIAVRLRYFLRITVARAQYTADAVREFDVCVQHLDDEPAAPPAPIRMEVGIENALHIEFEHDKNKYHLSDLVIGKIYFVTVQIQIKRMEMEIRKKELAGAGVNTVSESETMLKFEVMDGAPVQGESIPVRMFLTGSKSLTPTYRSVNNKFSVKYFLNLVLVDVDDRRYFKQSEITLWRAAYS